MKKSLFKFALVCILVGDKFSLPIVFVFLEVTYILFCLGLELFHTSSMALVIFPFTGVMSVLVLVVAGSIGFAVLDVSLIVAVIADESAKSTDGIVFPLALIESAILEDKLAPSMPSVVVVILSKINPSGVEVGALEDECALRPGLQGLQPLPNTGHHRIERWKLDPL